MEQAINQAISKLNKQNRSKKRITSQLTEVTKDFTTGEEQSEKQTSKRYIPAEPPYVKLYVEDISALHQLPKGSSSLLHELLREVGYEGRINLNSSVKKRIAKNLEYKNVQSVSNGLRTLCDKAMLRNIERGVYEVNPHLFGRGDWSNIFEKRQEFSFTVFYDKDGNRKIKTDFEKEDSIEKELRENTIVLDRATGEARKLTEKEIKEFLGVEEEEKEKEEKEEEA